MTTNWREKLEAAADQDIDDLGFVVGPEKVLLSDALALLERAYADGRADGLAQGAKWVDGLYEDTRDAEGETFTVRSIRSTRDALRVALAAARGTP